MAHDGTGSLWDTTSPKPSEPVGDACKEIRDLRVGTGLRMDNEHTAPSATTEDAGGCLHKMGSARAYVGTGSPDNSGTNLIGVSFNDDNDEGRLYIDASTSDYALWVFVNESWVQPSLGSGTSTPSDGTTPSGTSIDPDGITIAIVSPSGVDKLAVKYDENYMAIASGGLAVRLSDGLALNGTYGIKVQCKTSGGLNVDTNGVAIAFDSVGSIAYGTNGIKVQLNSAGGLSVNGGLRVNVGQGLEVDENKLQMKDVTIAVSGSEASAAWNSGTLELTVPDTTYTAGAGISITDGKITNTEIYTAGSPLFLSAGKTFGINFNQSDCKLSHFLSGKIQ